MGKIKEYLQNPEIQVSFGLGFTIILLAYVSKRVLHTEFSYLSLAAPGLVMLGFEVLYQSKEEKYRKYARPLYWNTAMIASALLVIAYYAYWPST